MVYVQVPRSKRMPFDKPPEGWTVRGGLPTGDVSYEDSIDPEFFHDERQAVFGRAWLRIGRVEQVPNVNDFFTRELHGLGADIIVARSPDGVVRAFHNMCPHRGAKLMWDRETQSDMCGNARRFTCKYHGWQFDTSGELRHCNREEWFADFDKGEHALVPLACDTWEGHIFINLDPSPQEALLEQLGPLADGLAGYPFGELTQVYRFTANLNANWKLLEDSILEAYHGNSLHHRLIDYGSTGPLPGAVGSYFELLGRNSIWSSAIPIAVIDDDVRKVRRSEEAFQSNMWGPLNPTDIGIRELPPFVNRTRHPDWSQDMLHFYPNFDLLFWRKNWTMEYEFWPVAVDRVHFETRMCFPPPRNASERLAQEMAVVETKEFLIQDQNLIETTQQRLSMRLRDRYPLSDEEVLIRNNHNSVQVAVRQFRDEMAGRKTKCQSSIA